MKKFLKNKSIIVILLTLVLTSGWFFISLAADPGSEEDPIISLSYFEDKIETLKEEITNGITKALNSKFEELKLSVENSLEEIKKDGVATPTQFEVVSLKANETLICEAGTEIIVRSGKSKIIASDVGGISDVTAGRDLANDEQIVNNHLLIVPRSDGRGITATVAGAVMVKGSYTKN